MAVCCVGADSAVEPRVRLCEGPLVEASLTLLGSSLGVDCAVPSVVPEPLGHVWPSRSDHFGPLGTGQRTPFR